MNLPALALVLAAAAQTPVADSAPGAALSVYLLTFDSGAASWERFGHNAIWIRDADAGTDLAYDYGNFSFREKNFYMRFARGLQRYWMKRAPVRAYLAAYEAQGRQIWAQELDLDAMAKHELQRFLEWNLREENRYYRYDYYLDNCSTRIRDAIDLVIAGALRRYGDSVPGAMSFRDQTRRLTANTPLLYTGLMIGLGQPVDQTVSAWDEMFLPITLRPHLNAVRIPGPGKTMRPLVLEERVLIASDRFPVPARPTSMALPLLALGTAIGVGLLGSGAAAARLPVMRRVFIGAGVTWSLVAGLAGALLLFLWALTDHRFSVANENMLQLNLLSVVMAAALPGATRPAGERTGDLGLRLAGVIVAVSLAGLVAKVAPMFDQANLEIIGLIAPIHLGLLGGLVAARRSG